MKKGVLAKKEKATKRLASSSGSDSEGEGAEFNGRCVVTMRLPVSPAVRTNTCIQMRPRMCVRAGMRGWTHTEAAVSKAKAGVEAQAASDKTCKR